MQVVGHTCRASVMRAMPCMSPSRRSCWSSAASVLQHSTYSKHSPAHQSMASLSHCGLERVLQVAVSWELVAWGCITVCVGRHHEAHPGLFSALAVAADPGLYGRERTLAAGVEHQHDGLALEGGCAGRRTARLDSKRHIRA
eukprot:scaffold302325_cov19-Tisochrysis_lutea.AAC.2